MSNWDRLVVMDLIDAIQRAKVDARVSEEQKTLLEALVQQFAHKAKTVDVHSEDVNALRNALCQICRLGEPCMLEGQQCCKSQVIG